MVQHVVGTGAGSQRGINRVAGIASDFRPQPQFWRSFERLFFRILAENPAKLALAKRLSFRILSPQFNERG